MFLLHLPITFLTALLISFCSASLSPPSAGPNWSEITPSRQLVYHDCQNGTFQCARLLVPLDWQDRTDSRTATIALVTLPAQVPANDTRFGGTIIVNPGGPGSSGADFVLVKGRHLQRTLDVPSTRHYEIVGFDPRGIGHSTPQIKCLDDPRRRQTWELENRGAGGDSGMGNGAPTVSSVSYSLAMIAGFNQHCLLVDDTRAGLDDRARAEADVRAGNATSYASTASVARDMLEIVKVIDVRRKSDYPGGFTGRRKTPRLQYLGFSYGTFLGSTFMSMFPGRVARMVLDGVMDVNDWVKGTLVSNTVGTDRVFVEFWRTCFKAGPMVCPFYSNRKFMSGPNNAEDRFWGWLGQVDDEPLIKEGLMHDPVIMTGNDIRKFIVSMSYNPGKSFRSLAKFLHDLITNQPHKMGGSYPTRGPLAPDQEHRVQRPRHRHGGHVSVSWNHTENGLPEQQQWGPMESMSAVVCADGDDIFQKSPEWWVKYIKRQESVSRVLGRAWAMTRARCHRWPFRPNWRYTGPFGSPRHDKNGKRGIPLAPILFLSSEHDPLTPISTAYAMLKQFAGSQLVVQEGIGHTAWRSGYTECVRSRVSNYFMTGDVQSKNIVRCPSMCDIWDESCNAERLSGEKDLEGGLKFENRFWPLHVPT
ncbi:hypothetical protein E4U55_002562 [Claviceps digitariae]|nr:hypothetical protein E4U55_002562 [Claviceps digitariae]